MTDYPTYEDVTKLIREFPRIPKRELWCGAEVFRVLRTEYGPDTLDLFEQMMIPMTAHVLLSVEVLVATDFAANQWELREDGVVTSQGYLIVQPRDDPGA